MSALAAVVAVLISAAAAGLIALQVFDRRDRRARAEELYALVESFDQGLCAYFDVSRAAIAAGRGAAPLEAAGWLEMRRDSARARALVGLYFPKLWPLVKRADVALAQAAAALRRYQQDRDDARFVRALDKSLDELKLAMEALKGGVVAAHRGGEGRRPVLLRRRRPDLRLAA